MSEQGENKGGRPRKFKTVKEMQKAIDAYFQRCDSATKNVVTKEGDVISVPHPKPYTIEGLVLALGFSDRKSLLDYEGYTDPEDAAFLHAIKNARMKVQENKVSGMLSGDYATAGAIFDLKNNHGYVDKQDVNMSANVRTTQVSEMSDDELQRIAAGGSAGAS